MHKSLETFSDKAVHQILTNFVFQKIKLYEEVFYLDCIIDQFI